MSDPRLKAAAALLVAVTIAAVDCDPAVDQPVELEGHVYTARDSRGIPGEPAAGLVVSTSLDPETTVTDQHGHFHLRTSGRIWGDDYYTIIVQSSGEVFR